MNNLTNLYPATEINPAYVQTMAEETAANGYKDIVQGNCGYVLVGKNLVPYTFLTRVQHIVEQSTFEYGLVLSEASIFDDGFLKSLDKDEREVLMPCVLMLIERGDFEVNLFESNDEEQAA